MDEAPILVDDETDIRRQCLSDALEFFNLSKMELREPSQVTHVAELFEDYIQAGETTTFTVVRNGIERTVR